MAQHAKSKPEDLSLDPQHPHQKFNTAAHICNTGAAEEEVDRFQMLARPPAYPISKLQGL